MFLCLGPTYGYFPITWGVLSTCNCERQTALRSERWHQKSEKIRNVNACCRRPEPHHPFPCYHPIHYHLLNRPWAHPNWKWHCDELLHRGYDVCVHVRVRWIEGHLGGPAALLLLLHLTRTHTHLLLGRIKVCSSAYKNGNRSTGEMKENKVFFLFSQGHICQSRDQPAISLNRQGRSATRCCVCVHMQSVYYHHDPLV